MVPTTHNTVDFHSCASRQFFGRVRHNVKNELEIWWKSTVQPKIRWKKNNKERPNQSTWTTKHKCRVHVMPGKHKSQNAITRIFLFWHNNYTASCVRKRIVCIGFVFFLLLCFFFPLFSLVRRLLILLMPERIIFPQHRPTMVLHSSYIAIASNSVQIFSFIIRN